MGLRYRYELKFLITKYDAFLLKQKLKCVANLDKHSLNENISYHINSLYFDSIDNDALQEKIDGVQYRKKYRIRSYNYSKDFIRLECKRKHDNMTLKDECILTFNQYQAIMNGNLELDIDNTLFQEFKNDYKLKLLKPSVIVSYDRLVFVKDASNTRITFDFNIQSGINNLNLFDKHHFIPVIEHDKMILEVKCDEYLPSEIMQILNEIPLQKEAYSKFVYCKIRGL